ncbi:MAG TPA: hypothetical protein VM735_01325, partial [Candidatus Kapabacteria bacterium]|nr:hypothetical protein [Candidatus Kapabacteria bacterium]
MTPPSKSRLLKRIAIGAVLLLAAILLLGLALARSVPSPNDEIAKLKAAGLPVSTLDLNSYYPPIPAESNAALLVIEAAAEFSTPSMELRGMVLPKGGEKVSPDLSRAIAGHIATNSTSLQILSKAARLQLSRYPIVFASNIPPAFPHLADVKNLVQLFSYEAAYHASRGESSSAFHSITNGFSVSATLRDEPFLISRLVYIACVAINVSSIETLLAHVPLSDAELQILSGELRRVEADFSVYGPRALISERAVGIDNFNTIAQAGQGSANPTQVLQGSFYRFLGFHDRDLRLYLEFMEGLIDARR